MMEAYITAYYWWWCFCGFRLEILRVAVKDEEMGKSKGLTFPSLYKSLQWQSQDEVRKQGFGENAAFPKSALEPASMLTQKVRETVLLMRGRVRWHQDDLILNLLEIKNCGLGYLNTFSPSRFCIK